MSEPEQEELNPEEVKVEQEKQSQEVEEARETAPEVGNSIYDALFTAAEEEPEVEEEREKPFSLSESLDQIERGEVEEVEEEPEAEPEPEVVQKEEPKPKKKKIKQVIDPEIEEEEESPKSLDPKSFPEPDPDKDFLDSLLPEERDLYDLAKFASDNMDGYEGKDKQFKEYFDKTKKYIEKRLMDDPHVDLANDDDYAEFINKNKPSFSQYDIKKVERERNINEAMRRIEEKQAPERERAKREQELAQKTPVVLAKKKQFRNFSTKAIPDDFADNVKDQESIKKFAETNPLEYQIVDTLTRELHLAGDTLLDITQGLVDYDPKNPTHDKLLGWVKKEQDDYINSGETQMDGKTFMRRERFYKLPESKRAPYYTWDDDDLLAILTLRAKQRIEQSVEMQRKLLEQSGYTRAQQAIAQAQQQQPVAPNPVPQRPTPPKVSSAPRPGNTPGAQTAPAQQKSAFESILGL